MTGVWPVDLYGRHWPVEEVVLGVGPGWRPLIRTLMRDLRALGWDGQVHQVKEKFGELRFHVGATTSAVFDRIDEATRESRTICERCGRPGSQRAVRGWYSTECLLHHLSRKARVARFRLRYFIREAYRWLKTIGGVGTTR
jgi:hypothetical protein